VQSKIKTFVKYIPYTLQTLFRMYLLSFKGMPL